MKTQGLSYLMLFFGLFALALVIYRRRMRRSAKR
jgi:hypothetical protein